MKQKIYSIFMLLSFLVILCHEMIPHHHHDEITEEFTTVHRENTKSDHLNNAHFHYVNGDKEQNNVSASEDHHRHTFPLHHHILATYDNDFVRVNAKENSPSKPLIYQLLFAQNITPEILNLTDDKIFWPPDYHLLIKSIFEPGAVGLRAPPAIA